MVQQFPVITVEGTPFECGMQYGAQAAARVAGSLEAHRRAITYYSGLEWRDAVERAAPYLPILERAAPGMVRELHGIAEGAGQPFADILALNVRAELTFTPQMAQGCNAFAVLPEASANGHTYLGQTWDNLVALRETCVVLRVRRPGEAEYLTVTEAGAPAMIGFNAQGIGVVRNALVADCHPAQVGVPMNAVHYHILAARTMGEAIGAVVAPSLDTAWHYMIAAPGDALSLEVAPPRVDFLHDEGGILTHSNHYVSVRLHVNDLGRKAMPDSLFRGHRLHRNLTARRGELDVEGVFAALSDHFGRPKSICRHPDAEDAVDGRMAAVFAVVMDLDARAMYLCEAEPCRGAYRAISL
ncbi:MAG: C45 family autoproteolytic acyltransferase/hydrolase [Chloroflexota bacterium]